MTIYNLSKFTLVVALATVIYNGILAALIVFAIYKFSGCR